MLRIVSYSDTVVFSLLFALFRTPLSFSLKFLQIGSHSRQSSWATPFPQIFADAWPADLHGLIFEGILRDRYTGHEGLLGSCADSMFESLTLCYAAHHYQVLPGELGWGMEVASL